MLEGSMRRNKRVLWVVLCSLVLAAIPLTSVFAKVGGVLVVSGPGIDDQLTIVDFEGIAKIEQAGFFEVSRSVDIPSGLGEGFQLAFYVDPQDMENSLAFEMVYHPMPDGQTGYVQMVTNLRDNMVPEGRWFQFPPTADKALRDLMTSNGVDLNAALASAAAEAEAAAPVVEAVQEPAPLPVTSAPAASLPVRDLGFALAALAVFIALSLAAVISVRRAQARRSTPTSFGED
jgi:hypothetical protein